ncbi:MAG: hypothetical protein R3285_06715, partial [Kiloniellales bacterium]|nr:hypothetical protein [Kiloniellales bacterium]
MKAARLNGDLLSRKGDARPVSGLAAGHGTPAGCPPRPALAAVDPGWAGPIPGGAPEPEQENRAPALKCDKFGRVRVSLRLDPERHLRLRLLAAHGCMSLQETLIAALDAYLGEEARNLPCDCLYGAGEAAHDNETDNETRA